MTGAELTDVARMAETTFGPEGAGTVERLQRAVDRYLELTAPLDQADPMQMSLRELDLLNLRNELLGR